MTTDRLTIGALVRLCRDVRTPFGMFEKGHVYEVVSMSFTDGRVYAVQLRNDGVGVFFINVNDVVLYTEDYDDGGLD